MIQNTAFAGYRHEVSNIGATAIASEFLKDLGSLKLLQNQHLFYYWIQIKCIDPKIGYVRVPDYIRDWNLI